MKILGLIPARGGSKTIPRKNIKEMCGKPLIAYTIEAAKNAGVFDRIVLTTDDHEIAAVGKSYGAEVPFMRPAELAQDHTPSLPAIQHAVSWLRDKEGYEPDAVMLLQPTAPLRQASHIREAVDLFLESGADSVVSVVPIPAHYSPFWAVVADETGWGRLFLGDPIRKRVSRRQDFPYPAYSHNGAIYLFKTSVLFDPEHPSLYGERVKVYPMDERFSVNIDGQEDWDEAERRMKNGKWKMESGE